MRVAKEKGNIVPKERKCPEDEDDAATYCEILICEG
jgi:hypothetical protein